MKFPSTSLPWSHCLDFFMLGSGLMLDPGLMLGSGLMLVACS